MTNKKNATMQGVEEKKKNQEKRKQEKEEKINKRIENIRIKWRRRGYT